MSTDRIRALRRQGKPDLSTPAKRLRHVVEVFDVQGGDDRLLITATSGIWDEPTGLTWGDLAALLAMVDPSAGTADEESAPVALDVDGDPFSVGDWADHIGGELDPRQVVKVGDGRIALAIGDSVTPLIPSSMYRNCGALR